MYILTVCFKNRKNYTTECVNYENLKFMLNLVYSGFGKYIITSFKYEKI